MKSSGKELRSIDGGVCAPNGFKGGVVCADCNGEKLPFGMIVSEKPCVAAGSFSMNEYIADPVSLSRKRLKIGRAQILLIHSGRANVFIEEGEDIADVFCRLAETHTGISEEDVLIASFGSVGKPIPTKPFAESFPSLVKTLSGGEEGDFSLKQAFGEAAKSFSYAFDLWGYPCKIGGVFSGGRETVALITTDVRISSKALKKILDTEMKDTLRLLNIDGVDSPNDGVFVLSSGSASNYIIDRIDGEYKKFSRILRSVLTEICMQKAAKEGTLLCRVSGAKSKQEARRIAKNLVGKPRIKELPYDPTPSKTLAFALWNETGTSLSGAEIRIRSKSGERVFFADGVPLPDGKETLKDFYEESPLEIVIDLGEGNFSATAYGSLKKPCKIFTE